MASLAKENTYCSLWVAWHMVAVLLKVFTQNEPELLAQACKLPHPADVSIGMILTDLRITTT